MKRLLLLSGLILASFTSNAQNLVADGGLEDTIKCPLSIGRFYHPTNTNEQYLNEWRATTLASPDYHNICGYSTFSPNNGDGYAGLLYYDPSEYREYVTALLSTPLSAGERYHVEYYYALSGGSTQAVDQMQIHFSAGVPLDSSWPPPGPLSLTPDLQASTTPTSTAWEAIQHCYVATGGEDAMTFGNFYDNAATTLTTVSGTGAVNAYYFLDDVSVVWFDTSVTNSGTMLSANMDDASYQWVDCDNSFSAIPGETSQDFSPTASGNYAVIVTMGVCVDTSGCHHVEFGTFGFGENEQKLEIYPNPTTGEFQIECSGIIEAIEIRDAVGRLVNTKADLSNQSKGIYFLNVKTDKGWIVERVVKE